MSEELVSNSSYQSDNDEEHSVKDDSDAAPDTDAEEHNNDPLLLTKTTQAGVVNEEDDLDEESDDVCELENENTIKTFEVSDSEFESPQSESQDSDSDMSDDYQPASKRRKANKDNNTSVENQEELNAKSILFSKFFQVVQRWEGNGIEVICKKCKKHYKGSEKVRSNFVRHLQLKHKDDYDYYIEFLKKASSLQLSAQQEAKTRKVAARAKEKENFKTILFSKYFTVVKTLNNGRHPRCDGVQVSCNMCKKEFKSYGKVYSNFTRHLRQRHETSYVEYTKARSFETQSTFIQDTFNKLVIRFIVEDRLPMATVNSEAFTQLIAFTNPKLGMMNQPTAISLMTSAYLSMINLIQNSIRENEHFCATVDIWSLKQINFLGYTLHWLDKSFTRQSFALRCKRFTGVQNSDRIRQMIQQIQTEFELNSHNVRYIITDNLTTMINTFNEYKIYGSQMYTADAAEPRELDLVGIPFDVFNANLSKRMRCAIHTFNLVATRHFVSILKSKSMYKKHEKIMHKCSCLWQKLSNSSIATEQIKTVLDSTPLKYPVPTQWSSFFESLRDLLHHQSEVNRLMLLFDQEAFTEIEFKCLQIYLDLLAPIAEAVKFLQSSEEMVFGYLLPTLARTRTKYLVMIQDEAQAIKSDVASSMLKAVEQRFSTYFNLTEDANEAIIASVLCPQAKTKWISALNSQCNANKVKGIINMTEKAVSSESDTETTVNTSLREKSKCARKEFRAYLADESVTFRMLDKYPMVKSAFLKYNAPLPSSEAVERLFALPDVLNSSQSAILSDNNFEKLLLLKANHFFK